MKKTIILCFFLLYLLSCSEDKNDALKPNQPPETYLFLKDSVIDNSTTSVQRIHWWGNDPDGEVVKYMYRWINLDDSEEDTLFKETRKEWETIYFPLKQENGRFRFEVKSVDNEGEEDPSPVAITFPIINSPPAVEFRMNSNPAEGVVENSFQYRTFYWTGSDIDGEETIVNYYYALDDTSQWEALPGWQGSVSFENLTPGEHYFYLKAKDIANAESEVIRYPKDLPNDADEGKWVVHEPVGNILLVDDYERENDNDGRLYYTGFLENENLEYSVWDIAEYLPYAAEDIRKTAEYFDVIIWYGDNEPHFPETEGIISYLYEQRKKMILSTVSIINSDNDSLYKFLPVDTVTHTSILRVMPQTDLISLTDDLPSLKVSKLLSYVNGFEVSSAAEAIYRLPEGDKYWEGTPVIALRAPKDSPCMYYFNLYLHKTDPEQTYSLMKTILER